MNPSMPSASVVSRRDALRDLCRLAAGIGASGLGLGGCAGGGGEASPATPAAAPPSPPVPNTTAAISLNTAAPGALLASDFAGLSYEKSKLTSPLFSGSNTAMIAMLRLLGPSVLRIGGNSVDKSSWKGVASGLTPILPADVDALAAFARATGWSVIYGINLADNTTANSVDEATYAATALGSSLLGLEIGNEPDLYASNGDRATTYTFADFDAEWTAVAAAIRQAIPGAVLTGPAAAYNINGYTAPFAHANGAQAALLTQHYYRANGQAATSTLDLLLQPDPTLLKNLQLLSAAASANALPLGYRMAECNSFYNGGAPDVSDAYGTALWSLDYMFACALAQCRGVNFHGGGNGTGYTPIADSNGVVVQARPVFHGMAMFAQLAQGHAVPASVTLGQSVNFTAYGVARTDGGTNVLLVNKDPAVTVIAAVDAGASVSAMTPLALTGPGLSATTGLLLGGAPIGADGTWSPQKATALPAANGRLTVDVPPLSALLLQSS
jgi:hypothetical protein